MNSRSECIARRISGHLIIFDSGFDAQPLAEQLSAFTPMPIPYRSPIDWTMWGTGAFFTLSGVLAIRFLAPVLRSRWTWATITVLTSLVMTSGYMFTRIRGMPNTAADGSWIAPGFQSQYGQETTVVATLCTLFSIKFVTSLYWFCRWSVVGFFPDAHACGATPILSHQTTHSDIRVVSSGIYSFLSTRVILQGEE